MRWQELGKVGQGSLDSPARERAFPTMAKDGDDVFSHNEKDAGKSKDQSLPQRPVIEHRASSVGALHLPGAFPMGVSAIGDEWIGPAPTALSVTDMATKNAASTRSLKNESIQVGDVSRMLALIDVHR